MNNINQESYLIGFKDGVSSTKEEIQNLLKDAIQNGTIIIQTGASNLFNIIDSVDAKDSKQEIIFMYKLRIYEKYEKNGLNVGNLKKEEFFTTKHDMNEKYKELTANGDTLNPTAWKLTKYGWVRLEGY